MMLEREGQQESIHGELFLERSGHGNSTIDKTNAKPLGGVHYLSKDPIQQLLSSASF